jgi:YHS domain-containing protein
MLQRRILAGLLAVWFVTSLIAFASKAATSERIVADPRTGVALYGYDAVAYFIDKSARAGVTQYEFKFAGLTWRFRSEANLAAFRHSPERYVPEFGGYDPLGVGEGVPLEGNPAFFAVHEEKLFLFAREQSLAKFLANPKNLYEAALNGWPVVKKKLVP